MTTEDRFSGALTPKRTAIHCTHCDGTGITAGVHSSVLCSYCLGAGITDSHYLATVVAR